MCMQTYGERVRLCEMGLGCNVCPSSCSHLQENVKGLQGEIRRLKAERMEAEQLKVIHTPAQSPKHSSAHVHRFIFFNHYYF